MSVFLWGLAIGLRIFLLTAGHVVLVPLLFAIPLGHEVRRRRPGYGRRS
jgi:hypothetical protein